ncbi:MAG: S8 family peptidase [Planctomycetota bacterium]
MIRYLHFLSFCIRVSAICTTVLCVSADAGLVVLDDELTNAWGVERIGAGFVHASNNKGAGVKIGIIDSGIDYTHPDLSANYAGGWDFVNNDDDPRDDFGHGTLVAGIVGAVDDGQGIVGVAPEASLYAYKILDSSGGGTFDRVIAALDRAIADGMDIVNMSFGSFGDPGQAVLDACERVAAAGILLVASAGNLGTFDGSGDNVVYPARYSSALAVAATTDLDERAFFSGTGPDLELAAPGYNIYTTDLFGGYAFESGTSMAAAHVTGAAALLIHAGFLDARGRLLSTAYDLGPAGFDTLYGYGLVDVHAAVIPAPSALGLALLGLSLVHRWFRSKS